MNLSEEFVLLAYRDDGKPATDRMHLDNGLGGSLLLELALAGRVDVQDKKVLVRDQSPTGDTVVDAALARIVADTRRHRPAHWVKKFAKGTRAHALESLVAQHVLRREQGTFLGVFPRALYPSAQSVEPVVKTEIHSRLRRAISASSAVDARTAALCALVAATGLDRKVFADLDRRRVKGRLKEIGAGSWASDAVKQTIRAIQASIAASISAASGGG